VAWWRRGGSDPAPSRSTGAAPAATPAPVQRAAWEELPSIRPMLTATPPVAPLDTFTGSLATARNPSFLAPLVHQVDPAGPSGHVDGLATPVAPQIMSGGSELAVVTRPADSRRSQLAGVVQRALAPTMRFSEAAATAPVGQAGVPAAPSAAPGPDRSPPSAPLLGPRLLEPVADPVQRSLTSAPDPGEFSTLPVVSSVTSRAGSAPSSASAVPTVSRLDPSEPQNRAHPGGHHGYDDAAGRGRGESLQRSATDEVPAAAPIVNAAPDEPGPAVAPFLGDAESNAPPLGARGSDAASSGDGPIAGIEADRQLPIVPPVTLPSPSTSRASAVQRVAASGQQSLPPGVEVPLVRRSVSPSYLPAPTAPTSSLRASFGPAPSTTSSVPRLPGLGAPLISSPQVAAPTTERIATQPHSADLPLEHGSSSPETAHVQRSTGVPLRAQSPTAWEAASAPAPGADSANQAPMLGVVEMMRVIDEGALTGGVDAVPANSDAGRPVQRTPGEGGPGSMSTEARSRPSGLGGPLQSRGLPSTGIASINTVQRAMSAMDGGGPPQVGVAPSPIPTAPTLGATESATLQRQLSQASATTPTTPPMTPTTRSPASTSMLDPSADGVAALPPTSTFTGDATEITLPHTVFTSGPPFGDHLAAVQRTASPELTPPPRGVDPVDRGWDEAVEFNEPPVAITSSTTAPLLGAASGVPGPPDSGFALSAGSAVPTATPVALQRTTSFPEFSQPLQRTTSSTLQSPGVPPSGAGFGAPLHSTPPPGSDRISSREMSFEQMFAPGAAAIASGAAYSDSPGSVVFRSPELATSSFGSSPTLGSDQGNGPAVQRFGLPSASSLVSSARNAASSYADTARQSVGGLADGARNAAGSYVDSARQTAGGYADTARQTAGGYADQARGLAGSAMDTAGGDAERAGDTATGLLDSARGAAGGLADRVGDAVDDAASTAGRAVDSAGGAARGLMTAAGDAASGTANDVAAGVAGAAAGVAGAAAGAAGALPTDLNELARRLFDPMSERFKTELWLDRERAGMITDLRR